METKVNYTLVGTFVLALGAMLVAGILWLASGGAWQKKYDVYLAVEDESVAGLNLDAPVKYNGVDVGKVQAIHLDLANPRRVNLLFAIERGTPVKVDTVAILKTQGLTGIAYVELNGGDASSPALTTKSGARYPQIQTSPSLATRLENVLSSTLSKLDSTSSNLNAILSKENQAAFHNALMDIAVVTHTIADRKDSIDSGLVDAAHTLKNTTKASAKAQELVERMTDGADAFGVDMKRFNTGTLPELERLLSELSTLSSSLRLLTEQTRRDPSALFFGRSTVPNGPGESEDKP
jgi:phospholipid/cholesterol/gamma-HCH transport system substrate-binding protein